MPERFEGRPGIFWSFMAVISSLFCFSMNYF